MKKDVILIADVFGRIFEVSTKKHGIYPLYFVSIHSYRYQRALKNTDINLQTVQDNDLILLFESKRRGGISSPMEGSYLL